jgi:signal transduction histidine kinase
MEDKSKLFSEGFSTAGSTGYGLFLIKRIIDIYGWQIQEKGDINKGAKFVIAISKKAHA